MPACMIMCHYILTISALRFLVDVLDERFKIILGNNVRGGCLAPKLWCSYGTFILLFCKKTHLKNIDSWCYNIDIKKALGAKTLQHFEILIIPPTFPSTVAIAKRRKSHERQKHLSGRRCGFASSLQSQFAPEENVSITKLWLMFSLVIWHAARHNNQRIAVSLTPLT